MKYLKSFESKVIYKNEEKYNWEFDYNVGDPVKFLEDEVNGSPAPGITKRIFIVQGRENTLVNKRNYYLLHDMDDYTFNWIGEECLRKATENELETNNDYQIWLLKQEIGADVDKYNL